MRFALVLFVAIVGCGRVGFGSLTISEVDASMPGAELDGGTDEPIDADGPLEDAFGDGRLEDASLGDAPPADAPPADAALEDAFAEDASLEDAPLEDASVEDASDASIGDVCPFADGVFGTFQVSGSTCDMSEHVTLGCYAERDVYDTVVKVTVPAGQQCSVMFRFGTYRVMAGVDVACTSGSYSSCGMLGEGGGFVFAGESTGHRYWLAIEALDASCGVWVFDLACGPAS